MFARQSELEFLLKAAPSIQADFLLEDTSVNDDIVYSSMLHMTNIMLKHGTNALKKYGIPTDSPNFKGSFTPLLTYLSLLKTERNLNAINRYGYKIVPIDKHIEQSVAEAAEYYTETLEDRENTMLNNILKLHSSKKTNGLVAIIGAFHCDSIKDKIIAKDNILEFRFVRALDKDFIHEVHQVLNYTKDEIIVNDYVIAHTPQETSTTVVCDLSEPSDEQWCMNWILNHAPLSGEQTNIEEEL